MNSQNRPVPSVAAYFPSLAQGFDINPTAHMFVEDIHLGLMPIGGRRTDKPFVVILDAQQDERERAQQVLATLARYRRHRPEEMLSDIVDTLAQHLAWNGEVVFEIIPDGDDPPFVLFNFPTKRLIRLPHCYMQLIPVKDWKYLKKRLVVISSNRVWHLKMPAKLGGRWGYRRVLAHLERSESLGPKFWRDDLERGKQDTDFDFQDYVRKAKIYCIRATRSWGWNTRDWSDKWWTEFFGVHRGIRFRLAQALLREHIIAELNRLMARLHIECEIKVSGLPTPNEIVEVLHSLEEGFISFSEAFDRASI